MKKTLLALLISASITSVSSAQVTDSLNISSFSNWFEPGMPAEPTYGIKYNGIWGWTNPANGDEFAIMGSSAGYHFINITDPNNPVQSDYVAGRRNNCIWREIKTYDHYAYLVSDDGNPNSFQIVDLQYLPDSVHVVYDSTNLFTRSHTIFVDGDKLYGGSVNGGSVGNASMAVFSLDNPEQPVLLRKLNQDFPSLSSIHDMYVRNDTIYASAGYDGLFLFRYDESANQFIYINSVTNYPGQGYNHSSALTDDGATLIFMDEVPDGMPVKVLDVADLQNLTVTTTFYSNTGATPHNPFIAGNLCFIAYYKDGLQVYDISNPASPVRVGYYDTYFQNPAGVYTGVAYAGAWGAYPYFPSGNVIVSDMQNGLFVLDVTQLTGVHENEKPNTSVYPNPVLQGKVLTIQSENLNNISQVYLSDIRGREIGVNYELVNNGLKIHTSGINPGMYILNITSGSGVITEKIIIN